MTRDDRYATTVTLVPRHARPIATWHLAMVGQKYSASRPQEVASRQLAETASMQRPDDQAQAGPTPLTTRAASGSSGVTPPSAADIGALGR